MEKTPSAERPVESKLRIIRAQCIHDMVGQLSKSSESTFDQENRAARTFDRRWTLAKEHYRFVLVNEEHRQAHPYLPLEQTLHAQVIERMFKFLAEIFTGENDREFSDMSIEIPYERAQELAALVAEFEEGR